MKVRQLSSWLARGQFPVIYRKFTTHTTKSRQALHTVTGTSIATTTTTTATSSPGTTTDAFCQWFYTTRSFHSGITGFGNARTRVWSRIDRASHAAWENEGGLVAVTVTVGTSSHSRGLRES